MAARLPDRPPEDLRCPDLLIALGLHEAAHGGLEEAVQGEAARVPEDHPRRLLLQVEEVESLA